MTVNVSSVAAGAVVALLVNTGWERLPDMDPKDGPTKPVFCRRFKRYTVKCVVGPLWTTYYRLSGETVFDMDSCKTENTESVRRNLSALLPDAKG